MKQRFRRHRYEIEAVDIRIIPIPLDRYMVLQYAIHYVHAACAQKI